MINMSEDQIREIIKEEVAKELEEMQLDELGLGSRMAAGLKGIGARVMRGGPEGQQRAKAASIFMSASKQAADSKAEFVNDFVKLFGDVTAIPRDLQANFMQIKRKYERVATDLATLSQQAKVRR